MYIYIIKNYYIFKLPYFNEKTYLLRFSNMLNRLIMSKIEFGFFKYQYQCIFANIPKNL
jgi:hypothetical protein